MVADLEINAAYSDKAALRKFAESVDVITLEFENIPTEVIDMLSTIKPVLPGKRALFICQHRQREKCSFTLRSQLGNRSEIGGWNALLRATLASPISPVLPGRRSLSAPESQTQM